MPDEKTGGATKPARILRVYFLQQWYGLADEALEDALYDSQGLQRFARIDLAAQGVPDATPLLNFRHLLETHDLCKGLFTAINADLAARALLLREGTREEFIPASESEVSRTGEERASTLYALWPRQHGNRRANAGGGVKKHESNRLKR